MNESSVQSAMKLLALVANYCNEESYPLFRKSAEKFTQQLSETANTSQSLRFFDYHYKLVYQREFQNNRKKNSVLSVKILATTTKLTSELILSERMLLTLLIADAIKNSKEQAAHIVGLHDVISETLGISDVDITRLRLFTFSGSLALTAKDGFLIIDGLPSVFENHLFREHMTGNIVFVQAIQNKEIFFKLSHGSDTLYLEGQAIEPGTPYRFPWGATLITHKTEKISYALVQQNLRIKKKERPSYVAHNISITDSKNQPIVYPFSFSAYQGECVGLTGSPGSGKSMIIQCLMGLRNVSTGNITYGGKLFNKSDIYTTQWENIGIITPKTEYVELTVFQYLSLTAQLVYPHYSKKEISSYIESVLRTEEGRLIPETLHHQPLKKVASRSFRFALQIVREIIRGSNILFADAPFERLTLAESKDVCRLISLMNARGCIFFISCARPSFDEFRMFDKLIIFDKGYPIYHGSSSLVFDYFRSFEGSSGSYGNPFLTDRHFNPDELSEIIEHTEISQKHEFIRKRKPEDWYDLFLANNEIGVIQDDKKKQNSDTLFINKKKKQNSDLQRAKMLLVNHFHIVLLQKEKFMYRFGLNAIMTLFITYLLFAIRYFFYISNENLVVFSFVLFGTSSGHWASKLIDSKNQEMEQHLQLKQYANELQLNCLLTIALLFVVQYIILLAGLSFFISKSSNLFHYTYFSIFLTVAVFIVIRLQSNKKKL